MPGLFSIVEDAAAALFAGVLHFMHGAEQTAEHAAETLSSGVSDGADLAALSPVPSSWARYGGARPDNVGSLLMVPGVETTEDDFRHKLEEVAATLGVPADCLLVMMSAESGINPHAINDADPGYPAVGLIQATMGAGIPGFSSLDQLLSIAQLSAVEQLSAVVLPFYQALTRQHPALLRDPHPGAVMLANFWPAAVGLPEDFVIARQGDKVYGPNRALDLGAKGTITVGDLYQRAETWARKANGRRLTLDGHTIDSAESAPDGLYELTTGGAPARTFGLADAVESGNHDPIRWREVELPGLDLVVMTPIEPLRMEVDGESLWTPCTYSEQVRICRALECVSATEKIARAIWEAAEVKLGAFPINTDDAHRAALETVRQYNAAIEAELQAEGIDPTETLVRDFGKRWILHVQMKRNGACNFGGIPVDGGAAIQEPGSHHGPDYTDYMQLCFDIVRIDARRLSTGEAVNLCDLIVAAAPELAPFVEVYRAA